MSKEIVATLKNEFDTRMSVAEQGDKISPALAMEYIARLLLDNTYLLRERPPLGGGLNISDEKLFEWVAAKAYQEVIRVPREDNPFVFQESLLVFPDGSLGKKTWGDYNAAAKKYDRFTILHAASGKTVVQPRGLRNEYGKITDEPELVMGARQLPIVVSPIRNKLAASYSFMKGPQAGKLYDQDERVGPYHGTIINGVWTANNDAIIFDGSKPTRIDLGSPKLGNTSLFCGPNERFGGFFVTRVNTGQSVGGTFIASGEKVGAERVFRFFIQEASGTLSINARGVITNNLWMNDGEWHCFSFMWDGLNLWWRVDLSDPQSVPIGNAAEDLSTNIFIGSRPTLAVPLNGRMGYADIVDASFTMAEWTTVVENIDTLMKAKGFNFLKGQAPIITNPFQPAVRAALVADYDFRRDVNASRLMDRDNLAGFFHATIHNAAWAGNNDSLAFGGTAYVNTGVRKMRNTELFPGAGDKFVATVVAKVEPGGGGTLLDAGESGASRQCRIYVQEATGQFSVNLRGHITTDLGLNDGRMHGHSVIWTGSGAFYMRDGGNLVPLQVGTNAKGVENIHFGMRSDRHNATALRGGRITYIGILDDGSEMLARGLEQTLHNRLALRGYGFLGQDQTPVADPLAAVRAHVALDYNHAQGQSASLLYDRDSRVGPHHAQIVGAQWSDKGVMLIYPGDAYTDTGIASFGATNLLCAAGQEFTVFVVGRIPLNNADIGGTFLDKGADAAGLRQIRIFRRPSDNTWGVVLRGGGSGEILGVNDGAWHCHSVRWNGAAAHYRLDKGATRTLTVGTGGQSPSNLILGARAGGSAFLNGREEYVLVLDKALDDAAWVGAIEGLNTILASRGAEYAFL